MTSNEEQAGAFELSEQPRNSSRCPDSPPTAAIKEPDASVGIDHPSLSPLTNTGEPLSSAWHVLQ
jgi:hypothetical protein